MLEKSHLAPDGGCLSVLSTSPKSATICFSSPCGTVSRSVSLWKGKEDRHARLR
ncbi:hypothetical protein AN958_11714 [Leucoagaricus sp. SymC.cos]|nr:hypothetical protein AN958_11714 [Leucoagaricus sp. SymC.cos]